MQLPPEEQEFIRRAFHIEHKPIQQIERETGHYRQSIRRAISSSFPFPDASFADPILTTASLSRLTHKGRIVEFVDELFAIVTGCGRKGREFSPSRRSGRFV